MIFSTLPYPPPGRTGIVRSDGLRDGDLDAGEEVLQHRLQRQADDDTGGPGRYQKADTTYRRTPSVDIKAAEIASVTIKGRRHPAQDPSMAR